MKKPNWLRVTHKASSDLHEVADTVESLSIHTICDYAKCPNRSECYGNKTATFLILGNVCTRNCKYCNVDNQKTKDLDPSEPFQLKHAAEQLKLEHVVITSVTRDDLTDGGSTHFAHVVNTVKTSLYKPIVEVLIPDFNGDYDSIMRIIESHPNVIGHNLETVKRLFNDVRPEANYEQSLHVLQTLSDNTEAYIKSGFMLGLGETDEEVVELLSDLKKAGCQIVTIGQYLQPSQDHYPVKSYISPDKFDHYKGIAEKLGFLYIASGPLVRSSYMASEAVKHINSHMSKKEQAVDKSENSW